jgi:hypothetical protein
VKNAINEAKNIAEIIASTLNVKLLNVKKYVNSTEEYLTWDQKILILKLNF